MSKRPTHEEALVALSDPAVPVAEALRVFERAYRRSNDATCAFVLHVGGICRIERIRRAERGA